MKFNRLPLFVSCCFVSVLLLFSCSEETPEATVSEQEEETKREEQTTGVTFSSVINQFDATALIVPEGAQTDIIFQGARDSVMTDEGVMRLSKPKIDFLAYIPVNGSSEHGQIFMNHELRASNDVLGDGGGMSWLEVKKINGKWQQVGDAHYIDFAPLGGTWHNCGGEVTPHNTIMTAEEYPTKDNAELYAEGKHFRDTSDFNGLKRFENFGWMVEVDIETKKPLHKLWHMGRYSHEDTYSTPDGKTVYLTDDYGPAVFFKFEAETPSDYTKGQLFAYKQSEDGETGEWIALPMDMQSLINARDVALSKGATMFKSHEWIDAIDGKIYITESGGSFDYSEGIAKGANIAYHYRQEPFYYGDNKVVDLFGRVLVFDPFTNKMSVFLEGGKMPDGGYMTKPDGMIASNIRGKDYLLICEDAGMGTLREAKIESYEQNTQYLEIYMVPVKDGQAELEDIKRLTAGPAGCEPTGLAFTPDKKTLFLTIQHPDSDNPLPYNKPTIVALTGIFE